MENVNFVGLSPTESLGPGGGLVELSALWPKTPLLAKDDAASNAADAGLRRPRAEFYLAPGLNGAPLEAVPPFQRECCGHLPESAPLRHYPKAQGSAPDGDVPRARRAQIAPAPPELSL